MKKVWKLFKEYCYLSDISDHPVLRIYEDFSGAVTKNSFSQTWIPDVGDTRYLIFGFTGKKELKKKLKKAIKKAKK